MKKRRKIYLILILITFVILSIPRITLLLSSIKKLHYYQDEIVKLETENKILKEKIEKIENDPYYIEKLLRENYGLIKEGEIVYRIKE
ncbi:MAG TPA: septum formation initiator family protein [bacterium]|nr:septum formation initiator family protein [bacterium]